MAKARLLNWAMAAWIGMTGWAMAQERTVVVELYTSQGCSSCPPADQFLEALAMQNDIIALSLHVDYWDYLGWKDHLADPKFAVRQRAYVQANHNQAASVPRHRECVYGTPLMIINGQDCVFGAYTREIASVINTHMKTNPLMQIDAERNGSSVKVRAPRPARAEPVLVQMVRLGADEAVSIRRGENAGRSITYVNVADEWEVVGKWDGRSDLNLSLTVADPRPVVILLQQPGPGAIVAAARLDP